MKTHFGTSSIKNKIGLKIRGFTLLEALMATAIIGFISLPLTTALIISSRSAIFSRNAYKASLYADSLLMSFERMLRTGGEISLPEYMADYYETETFDYLVRVNDLETNAIIEYKTNENLVSAISVTCLNDTLPETLSRSPDSAIVLGEGNNLIDVTYGNTFDVLTTDGGDLMITNHNGGNTLVRLWGNPRPVGILSSGGTVAAGFYTEQERGMYILLAEVWDKKGGSLAVRARLVFI